MKKLQAYILTILFLVPSVGIHLDMSHCCGSIENLGISHSANIELGSCCHIEKTEACDTQNEIIQAPVYQDLSVLSELAIDSPATLILPFYSAVYATIYSTPFVSQNSDTAIETRHSQSFLQVFLC